MRLTRIVGAALLAALLPSAVSAQVIISNFSAPIGTGTAFGSGASTQYKTFGFTMGAQSSGLGSVILTMTLDTGDLPVVSIYDDAGGMPGAELIVLDNPAVFIGQADYTFTPPTSFTFLANTAYWVYVRSDPVSGPAFLWEGTSPSTLPSGTATAIGYIFNGSSSSYYNRLEIQAGSGGAGTAYCFGDPGSGTPCPCGNDNDGSVPESGCANGVFASGAQLTGSGAASVGADTLVLATTGLEPSNAGLYFQADNDLSPGQVWGDGLQCAGGSLKRLGVRFADGTGYSDTSGYPQPISVKAGNVNAGDTKRYQCWYRNIVASPCGNDFNASNGYEVTWTL